MTIQTELFEAILTAESRARLAEIQGRILDAKKLWEEADDLRRLSVKAYSV